MENLGFNSVTFFTKYALISMENIAIFIKFSTAKPSCCRSLHCSIFYSQRDLLPQWKNSWLPCVEPTRSAQNRHLPPFLSLVRYLWSFLFHWEAPLTILEGMNSVRHPPEFTGLLDWRFPPPLMWWPMKEKRFRTSNFMLGPSRMFLCAVCNLCEHFAVTWKLGNKLFNCL